MFGATMTSPVLLDLSRVLRTTLYLVEQANYEGKDTSTVQELRVCLTKCIAELEARRAIDTNQLDRQL
jgi:hypothetical protein